MGRQSHSTKNNNNYKHHVRLSKKRKSKVNNKSEYPEGLISSLFILKTHMDLTEELTGKECSKGKMKIYATLIKVVSLIYNIDLETDDTLRKLMNSSAYDAFEVRALATIE